MAANDIYSLPDPGLRADSCLNPILQRRRTSRTFAARPVSMEEVTQLLWAAQGINAPDGRRTAPSAGALYPLELHLVSGQVDRLPAGIYRYDAVRHALRAEIMDDMRQAVAQAALDQDWVAQAPAIVVITAVDSRTTEKYGRRGIRYVHMEVGHASQNLLLQAAALGLAAATVGAFDDERLHRLLRLPEGERPLVILPVGHPHQRVRDSRLSAPASPSATAAMRP